MHNMFKHVKKDDSYKIENIELLGSDVKLHYTDDSDSSIEKLKKLADYLRYMSRISNSTLGDMVSILNPEVVIYDDPKGSIYLHNLKLNNLNGYNLRLMTQGFIYGYDDYVFDSYGLAPINRYLTLVGYKSIQLCVRCEDKREYRVTKMSFDDWIDIPKSMSGTHIHIENDMYVSRISISKLLTVIGYNYTVPVTSLSDSDIKNGVVADDDLDLLVRGTRIIKRYNKEGHTITIFRLLEVINGLLYHNKFDDIPNSNSMFVECLLSRLGIDYIRTKNI